MENNEFKDWLTHDKKFKEATVSDVVSRCNRIERLLKVSLDDECHDSNAVQMFASSLVPKMKPYLKPDVNLTYTVGILRRAVRLYAEFKGIEVIKPYQTYS